MKKDFNPRLLLRKDKKRKKDGKMPLWVLFSYPRKKGKKYSLGFHFSEDEWSKLENLPYDLKDRAIVSAELSRIKNELATCIIKGEKISQITLKEIVKNNHIEDPMEKDFMEFFEKDFLKRKKSRVREATYNAYENTFNVLCDFIRAVRHNNPIKYKDVNEDLIYSFLRFLKERSIKMGKVVKNPTYPHYCHKIKEVIKNLQKQNYNIKNPFDKNCIQIQPAQINDTYLYPKEILLYRAISFVKTKPKIERIAINILLLSCCTGLRYSDIIKLRWKNIIRDKGFANCVIITRCKKTNTINYIPSSPMLRDIIISIFKESDEVEEDKKIFPTLPSHTTLLYHLHRINDYLKIPKNITFHAGRRTFATLCHLNSIDFYTTKRMLGHKITDITERYIKWDGFIASKDEYYLKNFDFKALVGQN